MKKLLIFILILFGLAAGGLFAVYMTLDEESYKVQIIEATKELTFLIIFSNFIFIFFLIITYNTDTQTF